MMSELRVEQWIIFAFPAAVLTPHGGKKGEEGRENILMFVSNLGAMGRVLCVDRILVSDLSSNDLVNCIGK